MALDYSRNPEGTGRTGKKGLGVLIGFFVAFVLICIAILVIKSEFTITSVDITGNEHYSADEIEDHVLNGRYGHNSIYLYIKCRFFGVEDVPFVEKMDVELLSPT